jgi:hypothetical protein
MVERLNATDYRDVAATEFEPERPLWQGPLTEYGQSYADQRINAIGTTDVVGIAEIRETANVIARRIERSELIARRALIAQHVGVVAVMAAGGVR